MEARGGMADLSDPAPSCPKRAGSGPPGPKTFPLPPAQIKSDTPYRVHEGGLKGLGMLGSGSQGQAMFI